MSKKVYGPPRTDFGPPPPGYIPGIGRGATGFTTRSDIGPAAERGVIIPERGMGPAEIQRLREREENLNEQNYDEFTGYGGSLFSGKYTAEDVEADRVYAEVDERRNVQRKRKEAEESNLSPAELAMLAVKRSKGQIVSDLTSLKKELSAVSETEWEALPDAVDLTRRPKQGSGREVRWISMSQMLYFIMNQTFQISLHQSIPIIPDLFFYSSFPFISSSLHRLSPQSPTACSSAAASPRPWKPRPAAPSPPLSSTTRSATSPKSPAHVRRLWRCP